MCNIICQLQPDQGPTTLHSSLCAADFLIFFHMKTENRAHAGNCMTTLALLKQRVGYFLAQV